MGARAAPAFGLTSRPASQGGLLLDAFFRAVAVGRCGGRTAGPSLPESGRKHTDSLTREAAPLEGGLRRGRAEMLTTIVPAKHSSRAAPSSRGRGRGRQARDWVGHRIHTSASSP